MTNATIIGLGWLGLPLAKQLKEDGYTVQGSVRESDNLEKAKNEGVNAFVFSTDGNEDIPEEVKKSTELLILTIPPFRNDETSVYAKALVNIAGQFPNVNRVVYTSSTGIYPHQSGIYTEEFHFMENEKNSELYQAEQQLHKALGEKLIVVRLAGLIGPNRHPVLQLQGQTRVKNPYGLVNLVHQDDVLRAIKTLIKAKASGIYNVASTEHPYRKEYYTKLYRYYNLKRIAFVETPWIERKISTAKLMSEFDFYYERSIMNLKDVLDVDDPASNAADYFIIPDLD